MICQICGKPAVHRHHIINGLGKRKQCESKYNPIPLCFECHWRVHYDIKELTKLKINLQRRYFGDGLSEAEVRRLMGGKLYLYKGEVAR